MKHLKHLSTNKFMDALIFASYVPDKSRMYVIEELFNSFLTYFSDVDFFIGINGTPCDEYIAYLDSLKNKLNITYAIVPKELEVKSDASAFQYALKLLKDSGSTYNLIWFGHTKGIVDDSHSRWRYIFLNEFFPDRDNITNKLNRSSAGTYSLYLTKHIGCEYFTNILEKFYTFDRKNFFSYLYLFSFYVIKGMYVHDFLNKCSPDFFTTNLEDIYIFERDFPQIAWRQGGYPIYKYWDTTNVVLGGFPEEHYKRDLENYI